MVLPIKNDAHSHDETGKLLRTVYDKLFHIYEDYNHACSNKNRIRRGDIVTSCMHWNAFLFVGLDVTSE